MSKSYSDGSGDDLLLELAVDRVEESSEESMHASASYSSSTARKADGDGAGVSWNSC